MDHLTFLQDLAIVMSVAAIVTVLFRQIGQPVVLGYILAGVIIGPHTPPFGLIGDQHTIKTLSELGVIFLMFSLGLEFSLRKLQKVGATALIAAMLEILLMVFVGYELGALFGWSSMDRIFLGAILAISSTTIIIKALEELGKKKEKFAQLVFGVLIVEDLLGILMIALLSAFAVTGSLAPSEVADTVVRLGAFLGVLLIGGLILVPRLINYVAKFRSDEMLLITVLGLCFGVTLVTVKVGYSIALGAFLIGAIIAEARQIAKIEQLTHPVRDLFSAVFFVSIGLLIDPGILARHWLSILAISAAVVVGKVVTCACGAFLGGNDMRSSLRVGMSLAQIGEFSFIIAALGLSLKVTSDFLYPVAVAVSAVTTLLTPYLIRSSDAVVAAFERYAPQRLQDRLEIYTRWVSRLGSRPSRPTGSSLLRKWSWQIFLNLLLVTAIFISAAFFRTRGRHLLPEIPGGEDMTKAALWLTAMLFSLPMLIAVFRKLQATGMLVSEMSVNHSAAGEHTATMRGVVSNIVLFVGTAAMALLIVLLSSAVLPSGKVLVVAALVLAAATILLRRSFIQIHAKAQIALRETLTQTPPAHPAAPVLPSTLKGAELEEFHLGPDSPAVGRMIGELQLRTATGASVVGIERAGENVINPGPHEELQSGDRLLLLGSVAQLEAARRFFDSKNTPRAA